MKYKDLRDFISALETQGELKRVSVPVDPKFEMTEVQRFFLKILLAITYPRCAICSARRIAWRWAWVNPA